jgi:hypothetical protein
MRKRFIVLTIAVMMTAGLFLLNSTATAQKKPKITPMCAQCHQPDEKILRGALGGVSAKAMTIQVNIGAAAWLTKYDDKTGLIGAESFGKIAKDGAIAVHIIEKDGVLYATKVSVKQPVKVPEEKLIKVDELAKLVALGPEKGNFVLADSRPGPRYHEGHIPGSISIYDAEFEKHIDKLPKEKDKLLIFYCGGVT